jgi:hypothetical protein
MSMRMTIVRRLSIYLVMAGIFLTGCSRPWQPQGLGISFKDAPRILKYGAVDRIKSGQTWRLFVAAEDPNGDMEDIIFEIYQPGQGWYPEHDRRLQGDASKAFSGYFYLNTPVGWRDDLWGLELTVRFRVRDKVGYTSEMISLPLKFIGRQVEQPIPPGFTEDEVRPLGAILIDLYREDQRERGGFGR